MNLELDKDYLADALNGYMKRFPELVANNINKKIDMPIRITYDDVFMCVKMQELHALNVSTDEGGLVANTGLVLGTTHTFAKVKEWKAPFGTWADIPGINKTSIKVALELAERDARDHLGSFLTDSGQTSGFPLKNGDYNFDVNLDAKIDSKYDIRTADIRSIGKELINLGQMVKEASNGQLKKVYADVYSTLDLKLIGNSAGGLTFQEIPRTRVAIRTIAYPKRIVDATNYFIGSKDSIIGAACGLDIFYDLMDSKFGSIEDITANIAEESVDFFYNSIPIDKIGWKPHKRIKVLLNPGVAGLFAHEALGHHVEQDLEDEQYGARFLRDCIGDKVSAKKLSIKFDPSYVVDGWHPYGSYFYDDEGTKGIPTHIIKNGVAMDTLTDLSFAKAYDSKPNGHAMLDYIRMSNLIIDDNQGVNPDELFEDIKGKGFYIKSGHGGFTSEIMKQARLMIDSLYFVDRQGELKPIAPLAPPFSKIRSKLAMIGFNLSMDSMDILHNVSALGKNVSSVGEPYKMPFPGAGHCGKEGEWTPTSHGGAYMLLDDILLTKNELDAPRKCLFFKKKK